MSPMPAIRSRWAAISRSGSSPTIDVTYEEWNKLYPGSVGNDLLVKEQRVWETLWWPAHRPMQVYFPVSGGGNPQMRNWARGIPQTNAGDMKMVTEWSKLGFVVRNDGAGIDAPSPSYK